ncbi:lipoprotein signal peptidase [Pseudomonas amygdali pv. mori str. 301020]|uniref:Lipoprotein signal peptidase n=1 Tax=Pseudomonas amygdali pv. mori str. 301020 TaxID=629261 RepID=A0A656GGC5_PSEA0|nr:lipoprotein signal peptidase [Pseudomonas amygdali pv. mori str. 301020]EGH25100.1 lipoprotein signal peptidase [Pseudomonas amygdali pv. mori str. 301020]
MRCKLQAKKLDFQRFDFRIKRGAKLMSNVGAKLKYFFVSLVVVVVDQMTKSIANANLDFGRSVKILPFFDIQLSYNSGAAFGFLSRAGGWQQILFSIVAICAIILLVGWIAKQPKHKIRYTFALALLLGGAIGNLIDRMVYGHVVDFVLLHWQDHNFPNFNIADSAITIGVLLLMLDSFEVKGIVDDKP